jgi:hypothetical protein
MTSKHCIRLATLNLAPEPGDHRSVQALLALLRS